MKKTLGLFIVILLCSGCTILPKNKCMGSYDKKIVSHDLTFKGDYQICSNYKKQPIFKNADQAFTSLKKDYKDTLTTVKETFKLKNLNEANLSDYQKYSNQLIATSDETKKSASDLATLLEIYQNGKEK